MYSCCSPEEFVEGIHTLKAHKKEEAEIVITRFNEDLAWTEGIGHLCTVYNKGADNINKELKINKIVSVPNYGLGIETMLRHIITNYDNLARTTLFCQGAVCDRPDQPLQPLVWYIGNPSASDIRCVKHVLRDSSESRFQHRNGVSKAIGDFTFSEFRERVVRIPYRIGREFWVKGDWMSVGRDLIRSKPIEYYIWLYKCCQFERSVLVEELWYLERSWYSIFTRRLE